MHCHNELCVCRETFGNSDGFHQIKPFSVLVKQNKFFEFLTYSSDAKITMKHTSFLFPFMTALYPVSAWVSYGSNYCHA